jgi:hypothetical protein
MASTDQARVGASFARSCAGQGIRIQTNVLAKIRELHARAHHRNEDLTEQGQALRAQMRPFVALCSRLVEERARA